MLEQQFFKSRLEALQGYWIWICLTALLRGVEQILLQGLAVAGVRDKRSISERLADLYQDQGRVEEAAEISPHARIDSTVVTQVLESWPTENVLRHNTSIAFDEAGQPLSEMPTLKNLARMAPSESSHTNRKVGRNEPCPCGSGKKFNKCCNRDQR